MSAFDAIADGALLVSGLIGFARGANKEITRVVAFVFAAFVAVTSVRFTAAFARTAIHPSWLAVAVALLGAFLIVYVALRGLGSTLARNLQSTPSTAVDRISGLILGLGRGWILTGVFALLVEVGAPGGPAPAWAVRSSAWPAAAAAGRVLWSTAPLFVSLFHKTEQSISSAASDSPGSSVGVSH
jgi:membrane protein required for colicin V production